jgi:hypothetical protein
MEIEAQLRDDQDLRLQTWIPLDWARAYHQLGQVEECIKEGQEFYRRAVAMHSPHAVSQANKLLRSLEKDGYGNVQAVQDFREELQIVKAYI